MLFTRQLAVQLHTAGLAVFPCGARKAPAINKGESWHVAAARPPAEQTWPSNLIGVPVPPGAVIIDLDTYKGVTREQVEETLGCSLPWDAALIQVTGRGGQHYAFSVDWDVKFGSGLEGLSGLDTRVAGKGYICTGGGYDPQGAGIYALVHPASLPRLPDDCRAVLERVEYERPAASPGDPAESADIIEALTYVDPGASRSEWVKIGLALRSHFQDDEGTGGDLFHAWSAGEYWRDGAPDNYIPEHVEGQWSSFKPEGDTNIASLFYVAIRGGWVPPPSLDTSLAFGQDAAPAADFRALIDRITAEGGDPASTSELADAVQGMQCSPLQRAALLATLNREMKEAGLLTKAVRMQLEDLASVPAVPHAPGQYGKNHTENALLFLEKFYPQGTLVRSDAVFYSYDGKAWTEILDADMDKAVSDAMLPSFPQNNVIQGTYAILQRAAAGMPGRIGDIPPDLVLFQNGVLNLHTGELLNHSRDYFTTNIMPYSFNAVATCPRWLAFLDEIFEGDPARVALLQEWFGYMLSGGQQYHKVMLLLGPARSGKGTIGRILAQLVGSQNFTGGSFSAFCSDAYLDSLRSKTVVFMGDAEQRIGVHKIGQVIERIKTISGGDAVTFDRKYKSTLSETMPCRITIAANSVPRLFDDSGALASRLLVLPIEVSFYGQENVSLFDELLQDIEGIAIWALQGMARLNSAGAFTLPEASRAEMKYIAETYSPITHFIEEMCTLGGDSVTWSHEAYNAYIAWALSMQDAHPMTRKTFISSFKDATRGRCRYGTQRRGDERMRGFIGLAISAAPSTGE